MQVVNLQNLGFFSNFEHDVSSFNHKVASDVTTAAHKVDTDAHLAALKINPEYASWAAKEIWKGAAACAADPTCKAALAKYGEAAIEAASAQNAKFQSIVHHAEHDVTTFNHKVAGGVSTFNHKVAGDVTTAAHKVETDVTSAEKAIGPYAAWAGHEAWQGATWCYADATCKAAVEKYGEKAVEAALKHSPAFIAHLKTEAMVAEHDAIIIAHNIGINATNTFNGFNAAAIAAGKRLGPGFKIAEADLKWAAGQTWKGVEWCYNFAPCKSAAMKYGTVAVQAGMMEMEKVTALQNLGFMSFVHHAEHDISHDAHVVAHGLSTAAKAVGPYASWAAKETWKGANACAANPTCKAAVEKYGTEAVEAAMKKGLMQQQIIILI